MSKRAALKSSCIFGTVITGFIGVAAASPVSAPVDGFSYQPDGSVVTLTQKGSGYGVWFETADGYTVLRDGQNQWVYAEPASSSLRSLTGQDGLTAGDLVVGRDDPAAAGLVPHLHDDSYRHAEEAFSTAYRSVSGSNPISDVSGTIPTVVILGYYDDALASSKCLHCGTTAVETFQQNVFNSVNTGQSVADYYGTMSKGAVTIAPVAETHGTANDGVIGWLRLGATTPEALASTTSSFKSNRIAADAVNAAMTYLDFTAYDTDGNGVISNREVAIVVVLAGYEGSYGRGESGGLLADDDETPRIWGQSRSFSGFSGVGIPSQSVNGKTVTINTTSNGFTYFIVGERHGNHAATMGIIVHEMGHAVFNLPDLYDTSAVSYGVGIWSSMSYGSWGQKVGDPAAGATPVVLDAWSRVALGWITPETPTSGETATIHAAGDASANVIKLPTANANEYFLVENRQKVGYDQGLTYLIYTSSFGGLAVWHIDDNVGTPRLNNDNADYTHKRVDILAAVGDSKIDEKLSYGQAANLYYSGNASATNDATAPGTKLYSGANSGVEISEVSVSMSPMTAKMVYSAGAESSNESVARAATTSGGGGGGGAFNPLLLVLPMLRVVFRRR